MLFTHCLVWPIIETLVNGACSPGGLNSEAICELPGTNSHWLVFDSSDTSTISIHEIKQQTLDLSLKLA